jgi:hypothetical protein
VFLALALNLALAQATTVPFSFEANHLVIPVIIDGKATYALFDTGSSDALDSRFAKSLGLRLTGHQLTYGAGEGSILASHTRVPSVAFGSITLRDQEFAVLPLPAALTHGNTTTVTAILGSEVLAHYVTRIDYVAQTMTFTPSAQFQYDGTGTEVPLQAGTSEAIVRASLDGISGTFQIDTGSSASLILTSPFVEAADLRAKYHLIGNMIIGRGVGGYSRADIARAKELRIGTFAIDNVVIDLSTDKRGAFASRWIDGNIGNDVLQRLNLTLDYARHVAYLEPNARTQIPTTANRAGMYVQNDNRNYFDVVDVLAGGPAFEAGLRTGDRITQIDGIPADQVTENAFWQLLREPPGSVHVFSIERPSTSLGTGSMRFDVSVTLRDTV